MTEFNENDPDLIRARVLLANKIHTPEYLFRLWRFLPTKSLGQPYVETYNPWNYGYEDLTR